MNNRLLFCISAAIFSFAFVSCGEKNPDEPLPDQYYRTYGEMNVKLNSVTVNEEYFDNGNAHIMIPAFNDRIYVEYNMEFCNGKTIDLTRKQPGYRPSSDRWGLNIFLRDSRQMLYWAGEPFAKSGDITSDLTKADKFHLSLNAKFNSFGATYEINYDGDATTETIDDGEEVETKPAKNFVNIKSDDVLNKELEAFYIASKTRAKVLVKVAESSYMVFDYLLDPYNGVEYDLSKSDQYALEQGYLGHIYTIGYCETPADFYDARIFYYGQNAEEYSFTGTCKPELTVAADGSAKFKIDLHSVASMGRHVDLVFDGPATKIEVATKSVCNEDDAPRVLSAVSNNH